MYTYIEYSRELYRTDHEKRASNRVQPATLSIESLHACIAAEAAVCQEFT